MFNIKKQIKNLYLSTVLGNLSLTGAWVAILAARGYDLVEIGIGETVFHITSLIFEIPSGVFADVFGRKKMLILSSIMKMIGNIFMIGSRSLSMVCLSLMFQALSYNFASGSGDALAYDSLRRVGAEGHYEKYESNQMVLYRICGGLSTLCAGLALSVGYRTAYGIDILIGIAQIWPLLSLREVSWSRERGQEAGKCGKQENRERRMWISVGRKLADCFRESVLFLRETKKAIGFMFCNSLIGAADILLLFFLQAKLPEAGIPDWTLGFALLFMELGGILGARVILRCRTPYRRLFAATAVLVCLGILAEHSGSVLIMAAGGFLTAFCDDAIQVRTNAVLQDMFPSEQRATLISAESFTFSVIMILLSSPAGFFFSWW